MRADRKGSIAAIAVVIAIMQVALPPEMMANTSRSMAPRWSVQVNKVDAGNVHIDPAFTAAIYENLLDELGKSKKFKEVFRSGDRNANDLPDLLILKTTVQAYTAGSETRRAVTTVSGATKLKVRSQLLTCEGQMIMERTLDGNVRFFGGNLRATHNLARNVATAVEQSKLPAPSRTFLFNRGAARLRLADAGLVPGVLNDDFRCAEILACATEWFRAGSQNRPLRLRRYRCSTLTLRIQKEGFLAGWPSIRAMAKSSASIQMRPRTENLVGFLGVISKT